ncbi:hypothetical protein BDA99DRAFT_536501 [Phascolomyces articulosus]|uniref:Uncharacterized protein n=1 Tax=Phascolomyces articulosus TaxID=60185 RepID=A0AAD5K1Q9_9FUNG|nr:hypothetical protein BDA99DRAFT_536501 [Phascolomyces articulosus]
MRPDDTKVVASFGSLTTGFGAEDVRNIIMDRKNIYEACDISFTTGGRKRYMTLANASACYSESNLGASHGTRLLSPCASKFIIIIIIIYQVVLYTCILLVSRLGLPFAILTPTFYKTVNDICFSCFSISYEQFLTPDIYSAYLDCAID